MDRSGLDWIYTSSERNAEVQLRSIPINIVSFVLATLWTSRKKTGKETAFQTIQLTNTASVFRLTAPTTANVERLELIVCRNIYKQISGFPDRCWNQFFAVIWRKYFGANKILWTILANDKMKNRLVTSQLTKIKSLILAASAKNTVKRSELVPR